MHITKNIPQPSIPIPAHIAAVWGGFLFEGLFVKTEGSMRITEMLRIWQHGCIELVTASCTILPELWRQISIRWNDEDADFPGVFEYSVVSPLGVWLGDYLLVHGGNFPDQAEITTQIAEHIEAFFAEGRTPGQLAAAAQVA